MKESGYYPPGAEFDPSAPYNEPVISDKDFDIECEFVMRKAVTVTTNDYVPEIDDENGHEYANTENTDWATAFENSGHFTINDLIDELREYVKADMETCAPNTGKGAHLKRLLEACDGWECESSYEY